VFFPNVDIFPAARTVVILTSDMDLFLAKFFAEGREVGGER